MVKLAISILFLDSKTKNVRRDKKIHFFLDNQGHLKNSLRV
jgi:hypothetical protein